MIKPRARFWTFLLGVASALTLTVVLTMAFMRPPVKDLTQLAGLIGLTGAASAALGYISHRLGWWRRMRSLGAALTLGYILAAGLTLLNVWLTARLMFISEHDLTLAGLLLVFAAGISIAFGHFLSGSIATSVGDLVEGARRLSQGDFSARVHVGGANEIARLGGAFNDMAARLEQARAEARKLEDARRDFVAWASHDLRTPLSSLRAMIDALADGVVTDGDGVLRYLRQSQAEIARLSSLIDDLFELAQVDAGQAASAIDHLSLADLISDALGAASARAQAKGVALKGSVQAGVDPSWAAPESIGRVLRNLLDNALRHTGAGGEIEVSASAEGDQLLVTVRDTGEGIPAPDLTHIFDRFFRGERSRRRDSDEGGAGLGLAIAKGLVESHAGRIWAESDLGKGATIHFSLPRFPHAGAIEGSASSPSQGLAADSIGVLR
ncbi:MAG TPA: ATP-binding protein [Anaerolineales bacterium]|nr:ATP-binding protein [Anaerolineales bacterium]